MSLGILNLFVPQFPHLKMGMIIIIPHKVVVNIKEITNVKVLEQFPAQSESSINANYY